MLFLPCLCLNRCPVPSQSTLKILPLRGKLTCTRKKLALSGGEFDFSVRLDFPAWLSLSLPSSTGLFRLVKLKGRIASVGLPLCLGDVDDDSALVGLLNRNESAAEASS